MGVRYLPGCGKRSERVKLIVRPWSLRIRAKILVWEVEGDETRTT